MSEWRDVKLERLGGLSSGKSVKPGGVGAFTVFGSNGAIGGSDMFTHRKGVIIGRVGAYCGSVEVSNRPFWASDNTIVFEPELDSDVLFAYFLLKHADLNRHAGGSAQPLLTQTALKALSFRVPDESGRSRIAEILAAFDDLIENNRRRIVVLEEMAQAIYREWFVDFRYPGHEDATFVDSPLGPIPDDWGTLRFGELVDLMKKTVDPSEIVGGSVLVGLEHIPRRRLTLDSWEQADEVGSRKALFSKGEILFGKIRPYFHKVSLAPVDGYCSSDAMVFRPKPGLDALATLIAFSQEFVDLASATANGTKMPRANWEVLAAHEVPVPSQQLLDAFTAVFSTSMEQCTAMMFANKRLSSIRDLLLPKLVTGEINVSGLDLDAVVGAVS